MTLNGTNIDGNTVLQTTTTDGSGLYLFSGLVPGTYTVTFGTPAGGYTLSPQNQGGDDTVDSDATPITQQSAPETLVARGVRPDFDAGFYQSASIGDFVWFDLNNGIQDGSKPGIPGVTVTLTGTTGSGTPVNTNTTTGLNGQYLFSNLQPGTYKVTFASPGAGYTASLQDQGGNDATDSDGSTVTLMTVNEVLTSATDLTYNQGLLPGYHVKSSLSMYPVSMV